MSHGHSLALSAEQSRIVQAVADTIEPTFRAAFIANVADRLTGMRHVTDADIVRAIDAVRANFNTITFDDYDDCI
jgi:hypothetical protein